jgi:hypothetical protein
MIKLEWGISPQFDKAIAWGARAIYNRPGEVDLLWDRQDMQGGTEEQRKEFAKWLNEYGIPEIKKMTKDEYLEPREDRYVERQLHDYHIIINPRSSYGYLLIGVYPVDNGTPNFIPAPVPSPVKKPEKKPKPRPFRPRNKW